MDDFRHSRDNINLRTSSGSGRARDWLLPSAVTLTVSLLLAAILLPFALSETGSGGREGEAVAAISYESSAEPSVESAVRANQLSVDAVNKVKKAIVSVVHRKPEAADGDESYFGSGGGLGSGIIFRLDRDRALVVTNQHVIDGAQELFVVMTDGEYRPARIVGADRITDLAVLEIERDGISASAEFGDSTLLQAGEAAIAIGNPLGLGYSQTVTAGVISVPLRTMPISLGRDGQVDWEIDMIQTDAPINRGNSGGALINLQGEVIGINSLKVAEFGVEGLGFAIPSNDAGIIIDSLLRDGKMRRPFLGVATRDLRLFGEGREQLELPERVRVGVVIQQTYGPAADAGLEPLDVIVKLDERDIGSMLELRKYLYMDKQIGDRVNVTFYRDGKLQTVKLELVEREEE